MLAARENCEEKPLKPVRGRGFLLAHNRNKSIAAACVSQSLTDGSPEGTHSNQDPVGYVESPPNKYPTIEEQYGKLGRSQSQHLRYRERKFNL